jgi:thymidylate kinase
VRESYLRQAAASSHWVRVAAEQPKEAVAAEIVNAVRSRLGLL